MQDPFSLVNSNPHLTPELLCPQIHKIMAGLLDLYTLTGNYEALGMAHREALYFDSYVESILAAMGRDHWLEMLNVEFGGMQEVLASLYTVTGDPRVLR